MQRPHQVTGRKGQVARPMQKPPDKSSDAEEVPRSEQRGKRTAERRENKIFHDRSQYVYENKQKDDTFTEKKGERNT
jgi:hypothetical protein